MNDGCVLESVRVQEDISGAHVMSKYLSPRRRFAITGGPKCEAFSTQHPYHAQQGPLLFPDHPYISLGPATVLMLTGSHVGGLRAQDSC